MGWFSSDKEEKAAPQSFDDTSSFGGGGGDHDFSGGGSVDLGGGGGMSASDMQQFAATIQQQALVQGIITDITEQALEKCLTGKPADNKLSGTQVACIHSTVNKWMDTNEFMNGRMAAKAQQANRGGMQMH